MNYHRCVIEYYILADRVLNREQKKKGIVNSASMGKDAPAKAFSQLELID